MADRYWVGGTGTWNTTSTTNWSLVSAISLAGASCSGTLLITTTSPALVVGMTIRSSTNVSLGTIASGAGNSWIVTIGGTFASQTMTAATAGAAVPTAADNVIFDTNSGGTFTITMTGGLLCLDITVSAGTVTFTGAGTLAVKGSMLLLSGTIWNATGTVTFNATTTGKTVTTNGVTFPCQFTFSGIGGAWTLGSDLTNTSTQISLIAGALNLGGYTCTCAIFNSTGTNTRAISFGSTNIVLTGTLSITSGTNFTCTTSGGGFTANATIARTHNTGASWTTTTAPNLTFTGTGSGTISITTGSYFNKLDYGTTTSSAGTATLNLNSLTLGNGTYTGLTINTIGDGVLNGNGKTIAKLTVNNTGTTTLAAAIITPQVTLTSGTLDLAGYTLTATSTFNTGTGTKNLTFNGGTVVCALAGSGAWDNNSNASGFTTTAGTGTGTINMTGATAKSFLGGGSTYNCTINQGGAGALTLAGNNTFLDITNSVQPASVLFTAGTTNSFNNFNLNGTAGNLITIGSSTAATHTLATLSGIVNVNYLSISYSVASGTNTWYANKTSTDVSNNTGWVFGAPVGAQFAVF
jgi:hypothetical protein